MTVIDPLRVYREYNPFREYNQEEAVKELISKQNKKGTVGDWLKPYREEYDQISKKRLTRLSKEELTREVMRTAIPMRMLLDTKRDGRLKAKASSTRVSRT